MADLFLDFASRQIRRYYGLFGWQEAKHLDILARWTNIAAWLCDDYCLMPVGFSLECHVLRRVMTSKAVLLTDGVIELPLRGTFDAFVRRRRETYSAYADDFEDLYTDDIPAFIERFGIAFKDRKSQSADSLVDRWSAGPDTSKLWLPVKRLGAAATDRIAGIPEHIRRNEAGIVWDGIINRLDAADHRFDDELQRILQSDFVESYCGEYGTQTLDELPYGWRDLRRTPPSDRTVSYRNFKASLDPLGLTELVERLAAESVILLRRRPGYLAFMSAYRSLAHDRQLLKRLSAAAGINDQGRAASVASAALARVGSRDPVLTTSEMDAIDDALAHASLQLQNAVSIASVGLPILGRDHARAQGEGMTTRKRIGIFVALGEEREVLERSDFGFSKDKHDRHLVAEKDGVIVEAYCAYGMGRVAAAVATMSYLHEQDTLPDLIIVVGLAGGFTAADMTEGAVVVPDLVFDLALRKVRDDKIEFRPDPYRSDARLRNYLQSNTFDRARWSADAHTYAEWPEHQRPNIRLDPLMSVDEVVSSLSHGELLRATSTKLAGVEMEAGGVFAAGAKMNVPVAVIRGISDKADPSKTDNAWRRRAMKTIISLLKSIDLARMLKPNA